MIPYLPQVRVHAHHLEGAGRGGEVAARLRRAARWVINLEGHATFHFSSHPVGALRSFSRGGLLRLMRMDKQRKAAFARSFSSGEVVVCSFRLLT